MSEPNDDTKEMSTGPAPLVARPRQPVLVMIAGPKLVVGSSWTVDRALTIGRAGEADIWLDEDGVSRHHLTARPTETGIEVLDQGSLNGTWVNGARVWQAPMRDGDTLQLGGELALRLLYRDQDEEAVARTLRERAMRDGLTNSYNRAYFMDQLRKEYASAVRYQHSLSLAILDLDHFKAVNDSHGHAAGDLVLRHFARTVLVMVRAEDTFGRIGGEEFAICLRQCPPREALRVLERIRGAVERLDVLYGGKRLQVTVSVGIAGIPKDAVPSDTALLELADKRLFQAKGEGRNNVCG